MFSMVEQIFAAMSFGLSWRRLLKVSLRIFHIAFINQHSGGHQFSTSSKLKQEFQRKPAVKGRNTLLRFQSLENKHSVSLWICAQSDSGKFISLSLLVVTLSHISQAQEAIPFLKFTSDITLPSFWCNH